ncbi:MAG: tetratricopeptide repeat protein [Terriglobales bacterium]
MRPNPLVLSPVLALLLITGAAAQDRALRIPLPKRDITTPVQKLNREGVKALKKHKLAKAQQLFYRAYLLDPNDPFTLNNLGYVSEMHGNIDRAERYYELSAENTSEATVAMASIPDAKGKTIASVAGHVGDHGMEINRYNVQAMGLLMKDRASEADLVLQKALELDPHNPFTQNNMGYAKEKEGEYEKAYANYSRAANSGSDQRIIVAMKDGWRGKKISDVARDNAKALSKMMERGETMEAKVARLNLQGVSAINRNDRTTARQDFERAYKMAPQDAFTLNNMGYLAELDGDQETADFYYEKAQEADHNGAIAAVATRKEVEGKPIRTVAAFGDNVISTRMEAEREARAAEGGPVILRRRDGSVVVDPDKPPPPADEEPIGNEPSQPENPSKIMQPLPENQQPPAANQPPSNNPGQVTPPLPDNQQPPTSNTPPWEKPAPNQGGNQPAGNPGGVMPPLPDNQQPPAAQPKQQQPPATQAKPKQGAVVDGIMQPLPDNQQPPETQQKPSQPPPK